MKIAIMGGTLDPVHNGHIEIARAVLAECGADGVLLLPAGDPPHKRRKASRWDRLEMARLAAQTLPGMEVSDIEVRREGTTYTVDTLRQLHAQRPGVQWLYIIGADTLKVLGSWRSFHEVAQLCEFAAVGRPGCGSAQMEADALRLQREYGARIHILDAAGPDISSTDVRNLIAEGNSAEHLVPAPVAAYIREKGLYMCGMSWSDAEEMLSGMIKPGRYEHTMGVVETAVRLAPKYGVNPQKARLAALLHDCAKSMDFAQMQSLVRENVPDADEEELSMEPVLHAPAGSVVARRVFGVRDEEILAAIRKHTLGDESMTPLDYLIYVSDFIEPNRKPFEGLEAARALAQVDIAQAARLCAELSNEYVISRGGKLNARTARMLNMQEEE